MTNEIREKAFEEPRTVKPIENNPSARVVTGNGKQTGLQFLLVVIALALVLATFASKDSYEVDVVSSPDLIFSTDMTKLGSNGWQPVTCRRASDSSDKMAYECVVSRKHRKFGWGN
jgi:hypothetical protein